MQGLSGKLQHWEIPAFSPLLQRKSQAIVPLSIPLSFCAPSVHAVHADVKRETATRLCANIANKIITRHSMKREKKKTKKKKVEE